MDLNRPLADYEDFGDFGIGVPSGDELKDLQFATCEGAETLSTPPFQPLGDGPKS